jgi:hypothetical protein
MWTYQEILLASNPIMVCGESYIKWSRLAFGIVFTHFEARIESSISNFSLWSSLVIGRIRLRETNQISSDSQDSEMESLQAYQLFITRILRIYNKAMDSLFVLQLLFLVGAATFVVSDLALKSSPIRRRVTWVPFLIAYLLLLPLLVVSYWMQHFRPPSNSENSGGFSEKRMERAISENFIHGAIIRKAKEPKDKAFALHAILQRLLTEQLPTPDYTRSTGEVYKSLSRHLIEVSNSLDVLLPAALKGYPGQPSWVPDWTQGFPDFWQNHQFLLPVSNPYWEWDLVGSRAILRVRGLHISNVSSCSKFRKTSVQYVEGEKGMHCENFANILTLSSRHRSYRNEFSPSSFTGTSIPYRELTRWASFFYSKSSKTPSEVLSLLTGSAISWNPKLLFTRKKILRTHISICNELAETDRSFFGAQEVHRRVQYTNPKNPKAWVEFLDGICKDNVQVGDKLIYISGLSSLVIVRADDGGSLRLVSPAVMGLKTKPGTEDLANVGVNFESDIRERELREFALT